MARAAKRRAAKAEAQPVQVETRKPYSAWAEAPLLLALILAPLVAGRLEEPLPGLCLACLVGAALLLRAVLPGAPPLARLGRPVLLLVLAFPVLAALTLFTAVTPGAAQLQIVFWAACAAALWLAADIQARGGAPRLIAALLGGGLTSAGLGVQEFLVHLRQGEPGWRVFGCPPALQQWGVFGFSNPNFYAGCLVLLLLVGLGLGLRRPDAFKPPIWTLVLGLFTAATSAAITATGSKGGLLSLGIGLVFLLVCAARAGLFRDREALVRAGILLTVLVTAGALCSGTILGREQARGAAAMAGMTAESAELCPPQPPAVHNPFRALRIDDFRFLTWKGTLEMAAQRPLLGWGAGSFDTAFAPHAIAGFTRHAHNSYLQLFAEAGIAAPLLWLLLLGPGIAALWRAAPDPEWSWAPGALAGLVASAVHNLTESLLFVPGIALITWAILGMALSLPPAAAPESAPRRAPTAAPRRAFQVLAGLGAVLLAASAWCALGRARLNTGRTELSQGDRFGAEETLRKAAALLPWDHQVQDALRIAAIQVGKDDQAREAAQRARDLAPWRPPSYAFLADVWRLQPELQNQVRAAAIYQAGLERAPRDVELLTAYAELRDAMGDRRQALQVYRRIAALEETPVGQVRALEEVLDYRFPRARMAIADAARDPKESFEQRRPAACFLARRRRLFDADPTPYAAIGDWRPNDPRDNERQLRNQEVGLWQLLAQEFRRRGENRLAELCDAEIPATEKSRDRLSELEEEYRRAQR